ncbi:hypothetical protein PA0818 [Candidatus Phytoplasma australiense]|uniref:Uncharacterized protein n=1 Tax=Phytoplasma australiense TaxID=59748 RepID=B1VB29_PHYAS|nr:hypothetical protein PA0818 [Candidatus Phytoplasma australiense]
MNNFKIVRKIFNKIMLCFIALYSICFFNKIQNSKKSVVYAAVSGDNENGKKDGSKNIPIKNNTNSGNPDTRLEITYVEREEEIENNSQESQNKLETAAKKELEEVDKIIDQINNNKYFKENETIKKSPTWEDAETRYKKAQTCLRDNKFQEALDELNELKELKDSRNMVVRTISNVASRVSSYFSESAASSPTPKKALVDIYKGIWMQVEAEEKKLETDTKKELQEVETIRNQINNETAEAKEFKNWQGAEIRYNKAKEYLDNKDFKNASDALKVPQGWFGLLTTTLLAVYQDIQKDINNQVEQQKNQLQEKLQEVEKNRNQITDKKYFQENEAIKNSKTWKDAEKRHETANEYLSNKYFQKTLDELKTLAKDYQAIWNQVEAQEKLENKPQEEFQNAKDIRDKITKNKYFQENKDTEISTNWKGSWQAAETRYEKTQTCLRDSKFQEALDELVSKGLFKTTTLEGDYQAILNQVKKTEKQAKFQQESQKNLENKAQEKLQTNLKKELKEVNETKKQITDNKYFQKNEAIKNSKTWQAAEERYKKANGHLENNEFQEALGELQTLAKDYQVILKQVEAQEEFEKVDTNRNKIIEEKYFQENKDTEISQTWKDAEERYKKANELLKNKDFQKALDQLKPSQGWFTKLKSYFYPSDDSQKSLADVYQAILQTILNEINEANEFNRKTTEDKKNWFSKLLNKIQIPSLNAQTDSSFTNDDPQKRLPAITNFFKRHPFFTKIFATALGEKVTDLDTIATKLAQNMFDGLGGEVHKQVEIAKKDVPEKAKSAIAQYITEIIVASVAAAVLFITTIYVIISKL